ncbi:MAG: MCE family protein [Solirubrobacteraceae bacterium]|nr:MCE family protein [Solirubrobacteraceae bacterium]
MNRHVPVAGVVLLIVVTVLTGIAFFVFNRAFGGPGSKVGQPPYEVTVHMDETGQLLEKSLVMVNGVKVGEVTKVDADSKGADITFAVQKKYRPLRQGATVAPGARTAFGEAYLRLNRGPQGNPELPSGTAIPATPIVQPDEALNTFGPGTREHVTGTLETIDKGISGGDGLNPERLRATLTSLNESVHRIRRITKSLDGQEDAIAGIVQNGNTVVQALAQKEQTLRSIVTDSRTTLSAVSGRTQELEDGIAETRLLTQSANTTLTNLPGLVSDAEPVVDDLSATAKTLKPVFGELRPTVRAAAGLVDSLPQFTDATVPALKSATPLIEGLQPLSAWLVPSLRNIIPLLDWLEPRSNGYTGVFANLASAAASGDVNGPWMRVFLMLDPRISLGREQICDPNHKGGGGSCNSAYPQPSDALNNQVGKKGDYPRLEAAPAP